MFSHAVSSSSFTTTAATPSGSCNSSPIRSGRIAACALPLGADASSRTLGGGGDRSSPALASLSGGLALSSWTSRLSRPEAEPALCDIDVGTPGGSGCLPPSLADCTSLEPIPGTLPVTGLPHSPQYSCPSGFGCPLGHTPASETPHAPQNFCSAGLG